jgi:NAD(P)-dependent dehydrogenase (short-subunit alcohol dehydrogenase family)/acyl carrier protein
VLTIVSEKTGYPTDMLDLELDLEADLGIDTVKQAELFATVRETYSIPRREDLRLSDYNTLTRVIQFVTDALGTTPVQAAPIPAAIPAASTPAANTAATPGLDHESIKNKVLTIVSEKTGYPTDMLDLELDLEADLGIDTVKQAELFATVRETYSIPRREDLRLSDYNSLNKVVQFVTDSLATPKQVSSMTEAAASQPEPTTSTAAPNALPALPRRVPMPVLRPRLDLCVPTGIALDDNQRILVVADRGKTADSLARKLRARKVKVVSLSASLTAVEMGEKVSELLKEGPITGVYFLPGLDVETPLSEMSFPEWQAGTERRAFALYHIFRALSSTAFLISATRFGGLHGLNGVCTSSPLSGLVCGFTKALGQERPDLFVKVVDFEADLAAPATAARLLEETLYDPGIVEVGWENDLRYGVSLLERPEGAPDFDLPQGSVFVVSGGSGAITSLIVLDLARATQGTFYLLDRNPLPDASDPDLQRLKDDRLGLLGEMMKRIAATGIKATPALAEQKLAGLDRAAATLDTLKQVEKAGGKAYYLTCDVTDAQSVQAAVEQVAQTSGHVDVFIHAAGIERSRHLESKPFDEFKLVVTVKSEGFYQIFKHLESAGALPRAVVFFSSIAGRFGNSGQTDYSSANDMLSKTASVLKQQYPGMKAISIDWGAWAEVGMSARGHIPELMQKAGIEMIHPNAAVPRVYAELLAGSGEVVVAGALGTMETLRQPGSIDVERANAALASGTPVHSMLSHVTGFHNQHGITLEATLDPTNEPYLKDHALNGIPVLPGVMGIEGFSIAARHITSTLAIEHGELEVIRLEDIHFLAPFKFYRDQPRSLTWKAVPVREAQGLVVNVVLESTLALKTRTAQTLQHFSGKVYLQPASQKPAVEAMAEPPNWTGRTTVGADDIYRLYFHGPAFQVLEGVQTEGDHVLGKLNSHLPPFTSTGHSLLSTPILVELCFQTAGIWEVGKTGILALPHSIESLTLHNRQVNGEAVYAEVSPMTHADGTMSFNARVIDSAGRLYLELHNYRTIGLPYSVEKHLVEPLQKLVDGQN